MTDILKVGEIASTHGLKGEVKVFPTTDDISRFKDLKNAIIKTPKRELSVEVTGCKFVGKFAVLKFKGFDDINDVEQFRHCGLFVTREDAVDLDDDEYFVADLVGLSVIDDITNQEIGVIKDVLPTGANDVYIIKRDGKEDLLVPAIKECIMDINIEEQTMLIHMMKGLE